MKKNVLFACALGLLLGGASCKKSLHEAAAGTDAPAKKTGSVDAVIPYDWDNVSIGGGGYVTGIVIHPTADRMYIRTDVGGAYRWDTANARWVQMLDALTTKVDGIALDKNSADRVYVALNDGIYRSDDKGATWTKKKSLTYDGNGDLRWVG